MPIADPQRVPGAGVAVVVAALALVVGMTSPGQAQELRGFFDTSYGVTTSKSSEGARSEFAIDRETLDVNWSKVVSPLLGYRLTLRAERADSTTKTNEGTTSNTAILIQPLADFTLASPVYSLNAGLRFRELFSEGNEVDPLQLSDRNYFLRFFLTPQGLPAASFIFDRTTSVDDRNTRDTADTRYQFTLQHTVGDATGSYAFSRDVLEDRILERTRTVDSHLGNLGYSSLFFGDHLAVQSTATVNHSTTTEEFLEPGTAVVNRALARGLRADPDVTPLSSMDVPVVTTPGLAAGGGNVPLPLFVSVGFELTVRDTIGEMEIAVAPEAPFTLPTNLGSFMSFRVFSTDDPTLATWTEIVGVSQAYDPLRNRFTLTFSATTARFFKAYVDRNDFGALVRATGISSGTTIGVLTGDERVRKDLSGTFTAGLVFTPVSWASASYNLTLTGNRQDPERITSWSGTHAGNVTVQVHRLLSVSGTVQYSFTESDQPEFQPTTSTSYTLNLGSTPLPTLTSSLTAARTENTLDGELQNRSDAVNLSVAAKVLPRLNADSTIGVSRSEDFLITRQTTLSETFALNLNAQVLPRVNTIFNYAVQRQDVSPALFGQDAVTVTHNIGGGTTYTLSRVVNFTTRFDYTIGPTSTAFSQSYKLDWVPTEKISTFVAYRSTTQESTVEQGRSVSGGSDAIQANIRWTVSRYLDLSANASYTRAVTGDSIQTVQSYNVAAGFRF